MVKSGSFCLALTDVIVYGMILMFPDIRRLFPRIRLSTAPYQISTVQSLDLIGDIFIYSSTPLEQLHTICYNLSG